MGGREWSSRVIRYLAGLLVVDEIQIADDRDVSLEEKHVLCNKTKNDYISYAIQKRLQRPYIVSTLMCTGL